ncbi:MAG: PQQ-binding-like beta-propeller repeat protein [Nitrospirae bacterium]|nr:PQQ-binding-like beta-propeller repeat protein [Nitrospirota bacterium]
MPGSNTFRVIRAAGSLAAAAVLLASCYATRDIPFVRSGDPRPYFRFLWRYPEHNPTREEWDGRIAPFETSDAVLANGRLFVTFAQHPALACLDSESGRELWSNTQSAIEGSVAAADGRVYAATVDGAVLALEASTGVELWRYVDREEFTTSPVVGGNRIFVVSSDDTVIALSSETGAPLWRYEPGYTADLAYRRTAPVSIDGARVYFTTADGVWVMLDAENGKPLDTVRLSDKLEKLSDLNLRPVFFRGLTILNTREGLYVHETENGDWKKWLDLAGTEAPLVIDDDIYLTSRAGHVVRMDMPHREIRWDTKLSEAYLTAPVLMGRLFLAAGSWNGGLYLLHKNSGEVMDRFMAQVPITSTPVVSGRKVFVRTHAGTIHALEFQPPL